MRPPFLLRGTLVCAVPLVLGACATQTATESPIRAGGSGITGLSPTLNSAVANAKDAPPPDPARIFRGSGVIVKGQQPGGVVGAVPQTQSAGSAVVLNFEGADLREVVRNILGDILNEAYTIDPAVGGQVTIRTSTGIPRELLPATLETLLRMNGATMVKEANIWKVVPQAAAVRGNVTPQLGGVQRALPQGYSVQIVPLRYVGAREMQKILEPFAREATAVRIDETRNLMILAGTEIELRHLIDTIDMFDIDWMSGMSAGIFTLHNADVKTIMQEFDRIVGARDQSPLAGILRIIPIERMNAILVISPNPQYLEEAKKWIDRLDSGSGEGTRFYVYNLQNQRAERVGPLLQQAFTGRATQPVCTSAPTTAPGTPPGQIVSPPGFTPQPATTVGTSPVTPAPGAAAAVGAAVGAAAAQTARAITGEGAGVVRNIQVVADKDQNTILIVATPSEYSIIEQALRKLDVPQRQVEIDVTIAEVTLTDDLNFGVDWVFRNAAPGGRGSGGNINRAPAFNPILPTSTTGVGLGLNLLQGFTYLINNAAYPGGIQAALSLLDQYGNTRVVSNPHVAALDNQKATIKSGDRIPICSQTAVGGTNNTFTTTAQYIDTGVLLQVTPHINAGGLVTLDIQAEVSNPSATQNPCDAPPIATRSVQTLVSVPSGRTMVMGGLISDTKANSSNGLQLVSRIPVLGGLFGKQELKNNRTELVLFVTPRVSDTTEDNEAILNDLRRRMQNLDRVFPGTSTWPASPPTYGDQMQRYLNPQFWDYPRPAGPRAVVPPAGQPTQTPEAGQPASAATPVPGQSQPVIVISPDAKPAAPPPQPPAAPPGNASLPPPAPSPGGAGVPQTPPPSPSPSGN